MLSAKDKERLEEIGVTFDIREEVALLDGNPGEAQRFKDASTFLRDLITRSSENSGGVGKEADRLRETLTEVGKWMSGGDFTGWENVLADIERAVGDGPMPNQLGTGGGGEEGV